MYEQFPAWLSQASVAFVTVNNLVVTNTFSVALQDRLTYASGGMDCHTFWEH